VRERGWDREGGSKSREESEDEDGEERYGTGGEVKMKIHFICLYFFEPEGGKNITP
jgi:hypothetical protein